MHYSPPLSAYIISKNMQNVNLKQTIICILFYSFMQNTLKKYNSLELMTQNRRCIFQILNVFYFFRTYIFSKFDVIFCFSNVKKLADQKIVGFTATQSFYTKRATN